MAWVLGRDRAGTGWPRGALAVSIVAILIGAWLNPFSQRRLGRLDEQSTLDRVLQYRGEQMRSVYADLGQPHVAPNGIALYDSHPWYAPFEWSSVRLREGFSGELLHAFIDD